MFRSLTTLGLFTVLLADVAPSGSCGDNGGRSRPTTLAFSAADCSCLPATLHVDISGQGSQDVVLQCGQTAGVDVEPGAERRIVVTQGTTVWYEASYRASGGRLPVALACPRR